MEDLKLIAQRVYDNLDKKFSEKKTEENLSNLQLPMKRESQEAQNDKNKEDFAKNSPKRENMHLKKPKLRDGSDHEHWERSIKDQFKINIKMRVRENLDEPHIKSHGQNPRDNYKPKDDRDGNRERSGNYGYERIRRNDHGGNKDFSDKRGHRNADSRKDHNRY
ncbi:hypothetical protein SteCoe_39773 [Stentor coeruleus]|uniref:Uncharacterized protein n=1 Tax=Stentor coeruleus TaxID=5963 RepID=A0A1R2AKI3_9CILI|nr:hypothetical protein SteCoe_39773 [Stentor coeruleus]